MATRAATLSPGRIPDKAVRLQLNRILASKTFSQVDRLKRFVGFIVDEAVAGRGGDLKEYVIGVQVFGKEPSFDPRTDPIVRVQARRLRTRLARYYIDEGNSDEVIVDLPKGGYGPVFRTREGAPAAKRSLTATLVRRNTVAVISDVAPKKLIGLTAGIFNFSANLAGIVTPLVIGYAYQATGTFVGPLIYIGVVALIGAFSYSVILGDIHRLEMEG